MASLSNFSAVSITGQEVPLSTYAGKTVLVVNTASQCGLTPQYVGLEELYQQYREQGLEILGFPCDQFGHQEPGTEAEIADFCQLNYGVSFPMFAKIDVNGANAHPLFAWLREEKSGMLGDAIKWNFTKFLVNPDGEVVQRYAPTTTPDKIAPDIAQLLPTA